MVLFLLVLFLVLVVMTGIKRFKALVNFVRAMLGKDNLD